MFDRFGAIEADFLSHYGIRLLAELGSMTWRTFMVLLEGLPSEGAFYRLMQADEHEKDELGRKRDEVRAEQRRVLGLGPAPAFRHRAG